MNPNRYLILAWMTGVVFILSAGFAFPALSHTPRIELIVFNSISLFLAMLIGACSWQAMKLKRPKKTYAITLFICSILGSAMFLFRLSQIPK